MFVAALYHAERNVSVSDVKKAGMRWGEVSELVRRKKEMKGRRRGERLGKGGGEKWSNEKRSDEIED